MVWIAAIADEVVSVLQVRTLLASFSVAKSIGISD
jgi:hypothetical protein